MSIIHIPEELSAQLAAHAHQRGQSVDVLAAEWLARDMQETYREDPHSAGPIPNDDPFFALAGIISSNDPGWSDRHDELIAKALMDEHANEAGDVPKVEGIRSDKDPLQDTAPVLDPWAGFLTTTHMPDETDSLDREIDFYFGGGTHEEWQARKKEDRL